MRRITKEVCLKAGTSKVYTNGCIRPTNVTSMAMTGLSSDQIAHSFNLQKNYQEQEKYKREGEMMTDEEKRVATMINMASGRNALRGLGNEFGPLDIQPAKEKNIYKEFNDLMKGSKTTDSRTGSFKKVRWL